MNESKNIEHSTFNIEHRMIRLTNSYWMLGVECLAGAKRSEDWWALNVFHSLNGGLP